MADEAIIRIKLEKSDLDDAKQGGGGGPSDGGGQTAAQRNERRGEGRTGDPEADRPLTKGDLERLIADQRAGREDEGKRRAGEREAMDRAIEKASAGDATSLGELQKAHGMSDSAVAKAVAEHRDRTDAEARAAAKRNESSHVQQGRAVASAAQGNLGPIANIAKGAAAKAVLGPELMATLGGAAAMGATGLGIVAGGVYAARAASAVGSGIGEAITGVGGNQGGVTGILTQIIAGVKREFNVIEETYKATRAASYFPGGTGSVVMKNAAKNLSVRQALDIEEGGADTDEIKMMMKNFVQDLGPDIAAAVWKATSEGVPAIGDLAWKTVKKLAFG